MRNPKSGRNYTQWLTKWTLALLLGALPGCGGGGGGGGGSNADSNQNQNDNGDGGGNANSNVNENDNDNRNGDELTVEIDGLPDTAADLGEQIQLRAVVTNEVGDLEYEWGVDQEELANLSAADIADPILSTQAEGQIEIILAVTDTITGATAKDAAQLVIAGPPEPPDEASIELPDVPPVRPGEFVTLLAMVAGPVPLSKTWAPDPDNILDAEALFFVDQGDGIAIFIVSDLLNFTYELTFTFTAEYSNGSTLSDDVVVTVFGGP